MCLIKDNYIKIAQVHYRLLAWKKKPKTNMVRNKVSMALKIGRSSKAQCIWFGIGTI